MMVKVKWVQQPKTGEWELQGAEPDEFYAELYRHIKPGVRRPKRFRLRARLALFWRTFVAARSRKR